VTVSVLVGGWCCVGRSCVVVVLLCVVWSCDEAALRSISHSRLSVLLSVCLFVCLSVCLLLVSLSCCCLLAAVFSAILVVVVFAAWLACVLTQLIALTVQTSDTDYSER